MAKRGVTEWLWAFQDTGNTFFDIERDLLVMLDEVGNIARVNPAFEKALGRTETSTLRCELIRLIHEDDLAAFIRSFDTYLDPQPVRLLKYGDGVFTVRLIAFKFRKTDAGLRGYLVLRPVEDASV